MCKLTKESDLENPCIVNDADVSLMSAEELKLKFMLTAEHEKLVKKRAEELRFYPDTLTREERDAVLACLTFEEMKPLFKTEMIFQKNQRLMKELSPEEKIDVRIYCNITLHFSEYGPMFEDGVLDDEALFIWTERYFRIMNRHGALVYENPYYFLTSDRRKRVLEAAAKLEPEEYLTKEEMQETGIHVPKTGGGVDGRN